MAVDIRATVTCSLGTLISGNLSDDYLQGSGLVKTRGSVEIAGTITPAIGTAVTFSYAKGGVTRSIPRKLRVLSSFADPYRRTTKVELGCKLTYLSDLQEPVDWSAFDDPENASYDAEDARIVTLPLYASSVMDKCLTELGITASSNPLTNAFSIAAFDFGAGYVQVLSDLLVSESYCGYLDANEVLQVFSLDVDGGTGPVFAEGDIVDLGPINTGQLPGEAVTVNYSTLKLKNPDADADSDFLNWESSSSNWIDQAVIAYTDSATGDTKTQIYRGIARKNTDTIYKKINGRELVDYTESDESTILAVAGGGYGSAYLSAGLSFPGSASVNKSTKVVYTYNEQGDLIGTKSTTREDAASVIGRLGFPLVFEGVGVGIPSGSITTGITIERLEKVVGQGGKPYGYKQTNVYGLWSQGIQGQQAIAESGTNINTVQDWLIVVDELNNTGLVLISSVSEWTYDGRAPERPPAADRTNAAYAKDGDPNNGWRTEQRAQLELALGSATAQRRIEFSMPYAPDDIFSGPSGGPFTATPSDAAAKANRYGRVQNRLLLGNRSGINLQLAPEKLPAAPFAPMYVQANGLTALYRANGNQWAFSSDGIVCSTDALFWAAVGGTGTFWFPVAPGITTLPSTPAIVDGAMNATSVVLPYNETAIYDAVVRTQLVVEKFEYGLELLTEIPALVLKVQADVRKIKKVAVPAAGVTVAAGVPVVSGGGSAQVPASAMTLAAVAPAVSSAAVAVPSVTLTLEALVPEISGTLSTDVAVPSAGLTLSATAPAVSSGASVAVPTKDITVAGLVPLRVGGVPTVKGSFINSDSTADTSHVLTVPTHASGDLLVAVLMWRLPESSLTAPAGWTLHTGDLLSSIVFSGAEQNLHVYTRTASSSEPASYTWSAASSVRNAGLMVSVRNGAIDAITENYGNAATATIATSADRLNLTVFTWIYSVNAPGTESYSQSASAGSLTEITDSPKTQARLSGGYISSAATVTSTHQSTTTTDNPNHGGICISID